MIVYDPKQWLSIVFHAYGRSVMRVLAPVMIFFTGFSALLCYLLLDVFHYHKEAFYTDHATHSLLGVVLGLFLVFRTNSAYERWWEGRKLWGQLVNSTRNLALKFNAFLPANHKGDREWYAIMIPNLVASLRDHLRKGADINELEPVDEHFMEEMKKARHVPNILSSMMYKKTTALYKSGDISNEQMFLVDKELKEFSDIIGACERIKHTPIPYSYMMYIKQFIFVYLITLPFSFVTTSGYLTVPIVMLLTFILFSVELIAEEIEDPFGIDTNDLPTSSLTVKIRENVREILMENP